jgi:hypothetical protein
MDGIAHRLNAQVELVTGPSGFDVCAARYVIG